jgi:ferritin-like metal-binding protein YciE
MAASANVEAAMQIESFRDMYIAELQELHSAEREFVAVLPRFAGSAHRKALKSALNAAIADARVEVERLGILLQSHGANPLDHTDQAMQALLRESERWRSMLANPNLQDAGLIDSIQRIIHYQIAACGTMTAYAGILGFDGDKRTLHGMLALKKSLDQSLSELAQSAVNQEAAVVA